MEKISEKISIEPNEKDKTFIVSRLIVEKLNADELLEVKKTIVDGMESLEKTATESQKNIEMLKSRIEHFEKQTVKAKLWSEQAKRTPK